MPMTTSISPSPIDRGGKMKWKLAVNANWTRDSVSASNAALHCVLRAMLAHDAPSGWRRPGSTGAALRDHQVLDLVGYDRYQP